MVFDLKDVTPRKFFNKVTYASDPNPENKLKIPDGEFIISAIMLKLINEIRLLRGL